MSKPRKSFLLHFDSLGILDKLTKEQAGELLLACRDYNLGKEVELDPILELVFFPFKSQFDRDVKKYQETVERNKHNGSKGGRPKNPEKPKKPSGLSKNQNKPKKPDNDNDSDNKNDSKNDKDIRALPQQVEASPVCYQLPLNDGSLFDVTHSQCQKWADLYPAVIIDTEVRKMIGWLDANPTKRKTRKGVMRFANGWISKVQDKGGTKQAPNGNILEASANSDWEQGIGDIF